MPDAAELLVVLTFAWTAFAALSVTLPQAVLWVRLVRAGADVAPYTLKTVAWTGTIGVILLWRTAIWLDFGYFGQRLLGPIDQRWPIDLALALAFAAAVNYAAALYHWTVTAGRGRRGTTEPNRADRLTTAGRELFHSFADDMTLPVSTLDDFARDDRLPEDVRSRAAEGLAYLDQAMARARELHREIRRLGGLS